MLLLEKAGLIPHTNCIPHLSKTHANVKSKANMELRSVESLDIMLLNLVTNTPKNGLKQLLEDEAKKINIIRRPLFEELANKEEMLVQFKVIVNNLHVQTIFV